MSQPERPGARRYGQRSGSSRRPSREMRERAEEMAELLDRAAPTARSRAGRRAAMPTAFVALGALAVGGVGVALSLEPAGQELSLPHLSSVPGSADIAHDPNATPGSSDPRRDADPAVAGIAPLAGVARPVPVQPGGGDGSRAAVPPAPPGRTIPPTAAPTTTSARPTTTRPTPAHPTRTTTRTTVPHSTAPSPRSTRPTTTAPTTSPTSRASGGVGDTARRARSTGDRTEQAHPRAGQSRPGIGAHGATPAS